MAHLDIDARRRARQGRLGLSSFFISLALLSLAPLLPLGAMGRAETQAEGARGAAAQPTASQAAGSGTAAASAELPLTRVVLFTSGLGYFERDGRIAGSRTVNLEFPAKGINDLLASLIVRDSGGGRVTSVDYASRDPLTRTLGSFEIDLTDNPALAAILLQARGEEVRIAAPESITGTIVSVESRPAAEISPRSSADAPGAAREAVFVNLLTPSGIRSFNIESVRSILFLNARLQADLAKALSLIAGDRSADRKRVAINFAGSGTREVSVAYMAETPVWKTAYRLVVGESTSFLQGWAIVENTSNEDWRNVGLDLVSGQPISFVMDLYRPVYTKRPEVSVPLPPSIMPQLYGESMGQPGAESQSGSAGGAASAEKLMRESLGGSRAYPAPSAAAPAAKGLMPARDEEGAAGAASIDLGQGVSAGAVGASLGELFRYSMVDPVTIPRNQSAMLPIVNQSIQGERLSVYNEGVLQAHPLAGFRIHNTTGLHLMGGPVSVFEGGAYAGEAQFDDIGPGGERLVSYSIDIDVEVSAHGTSLPDSITQVKINRGTLIVSRTLRRERDYTIVNRAARTKKLLIEYPLSSDWTLVEPVKPAEQTRDLYRFAVTLPGRAAAGGAESGSSSPTATGGTAADAAAPTTLRVVEERRSSQTVALTNVDSGTVAFYLKQQVVSAAVRDALAKLASLRGELADLARERQGIESQISGIHSDQERIRSNMSALDHGSTLYRRYVVTLNSQEDTLENLVGRLDSLQMSERAKQKEIDSYIDSLDLT